MLQTFHVFDRFGLNGKIGSLCPCDRNETRRGTEEKAFHHLHRDLQVSFSRGRVPCWAPKRPGRSPSFPAKPPDPSFSPLWSETLDRTGRLGDAPLHRVFNLSHGSCTDNEKRLESQARKRVFRRVLHKWHSAFSLSKPCPAFAVNEPETTAVNLSVSIACGKIAMRLYSR